MNEVVNIALRKMLRKLVLLIIIGSGISVTAQGTTLKICLFPEHQANDLLLHVVVDDFTDILSYQFGLSWDNTQYELVGYENLNPELNHFTEANFGPVKREVSENTNMIRTSWNEISATSVSLDQGAILFVMRFKKISNSIGLDFKVTGHRWFRNEVVNKKMELLTIDCKVENCLEDKEPTPALSGDLNLDDAEDDEIVLVMNVTPNPTSNFTVLEYNRKTSGKIEILGMDGSLMENISFTGLESYLVDMLNYSPGPYLLKFTEESGMVITKRLIRLR